jgi:hypothetical protein
MHIFLSPVLANQIIIKQFTEVVLSVHFSLWLPLGVFLLNNVTLGLISYGKFGRPRIT